MIHPMPLGHSRRQLWQWSALAVVSLAISGVFAGLLVLSRAPGTSESVPWPEDFFQKGLIVHVSLSFVVWFLAVFGALNTAMAPQINGHSRSDIGNFMERTSILLFAAGIILILIPAFRNQGTPSLNNYIPVIIDPLYYWGLFLLALGTLISVIRVFKDLNGVVGQSMDEWPLLICAGLLYVTAFVATGMSAEQLQAQPVNYDYNESLFWGAGHILQLVNVTLFLIASSILYRQTFKTSLAGRAFFIWTSSILVFLGLMGLSLFGIFEVEDPRHFSAFTKLKYALGVPVLMMVAALVTGLWRQRTKISWLDPASLSLASALVVFGIGTLLGFFVDGHDTRTPAHYHGLISGINLVFVGLFYVWFLPLLGRPLKPSKLLPVQIILYAGGQLLFVIGMFAAGGMGASRKIMGAGIDVDSFSAILATGLRDLGGGLAILGGVLFVVIALKSLFRPANTMP